MVLLAWILIEVMRLDPEQTSIHATTEDDSRVTAHLLLVGASSAALMGAAAAFVKASQTEGAGKLVLTAAGVATVVVSWAVVHVVFTLRYAHEYYSDPAGGIDFKNDEPPDYQDFAYVAFTIGMTFQVVRHRRPGSADPTVRAPPRAAGLRVRCGHPGRHHQRHRQRDPVALVRA